MSDTGLPNSDSSGASPYVSRASFLPIMNYVLQFVNNPEFDYDLFHRNLNEWKRLCRCNITVGTQKGIDSEI